jgi:DNA-binding transcriptional MerR regulator
MAHEIAKLLLEHADTAIRREEAIKTAMSLGMPLHEIEAYLDWLESVRSTRFSYPPEDVPGSNHKGKRN